MAGTLPPVLQFQFLDNNGDPVALGTVRSYLAGTLTPEPVYQDEDLASAFPNPYTLPASARMTLYLSPGKNYKIDVRDALGVSVPGFPVDNVPSVPASAQNVDVQGTAGEALTATDVCYISDGSGGKVAGQIYRADADFTYSSTLPEVLFAVASLATGESGTFRLVGAMEFAGPLTIGLAYYVSTAAGEITSTVPTNARFVGVAQSTTRLVITPQIPQSVAGPWTPVIGGSGGTSGQTYTAQSGSYVKVGRLVVCQFDVTLSALGTITSVAQIQGLPFVTDSTSGTLSIGFWANLATAVVWIGGFLGPGDSAATLQIATAAATGSVNVTQAHLSNTTRLIGSVTYRTLQ